MIKPQTTDNQEELFYSVNEDDRVLGSISRRKAHSGNQYIHRGVGILVYNDQRKLLMQQRSLTKDLYPGMWAISAGGHVTHGQSYEEAAQRESEEELGIKTPLILLYKYLLNLPQEREMEMLFKTVNIGPFKFNKEEVTRIKFFNLKELEKLILNNNIGVTPSSLVNLYYGCGILQRRKKEIEKMIVKIFNI